MIHLLIADDHDLIRRGLRGVFHETNHICVSAEATDGPGLIRELSLNDFDVLLLDINLPGRSGLDLLQDIRRLRPQLPVLILSIYEDDEYILGAIQHGANGYIPKSADPGELIRAIEQVASGKKYISEKLAHKILFHPDQMVTGKIHQSLTARELEVLRKIAEGKPPRQIAGEPCISVKTVNAHREHILQKMNMHSTAELIRYAMKEKLATGDW